MPSKVALLSSFLLLRGNSLFEKVRQRTCDLRRLFSRFFTTTSLCSCFICAKEINGTWYFFYRLCGSATIVSFFSRSSLKARRDKFVTWKFSAVQVACTSSKVTPVSYYGKAVAIFVSLVVVLSVEEKRAGISLFVILLVLYWSFVILFRDFCSSVIV